jgi:hypothetical protein
MKKFTSIIFILLLISSVFAQDKVIEPIGQKKGALSGVMEFFTKYWMWLLIAVVGGIIVVFIFLLIKKMKGKIDPFLVDYKKVKQMCKFQKDQSVKHIYLIHDKGLKYLGKYLGECITQDGFKNILLWKFKKWFLFWIPIKVDFFDLVKESYIVRCNMNKVYRYKTRDEKTGEEQLKQIQLVNDIISRDGDKLLVRGVGIERVRYFFYPVLRDKEGNVVDDKIEIFAREKDSALIDTMYQQVEEFANVSRELININPSVRYFVKTGEPVGKPKE